MCRPHDGRWASIQTVASLDRGVKDLLIPILLPTGVSFHPDLTPSSVPPSAVGLVRLIAAMLQPYTPSLSTKLLQQLNLPETALMLTDDLVKV